MGESNGSSSTQMVDNTARLISQDVNFTGNIVGLK